jgi:beta-glucosidase
MLGLLMAVSLQSFAQDGKVIKILAIGNSFSEDAVEQNLHELAEAEGFQTIIGNMYIGGCTLASHHDNMLNHKARYAYRKVGLDGIKKETLQTELETALQDEKWDYVSLQQASGSSGIYETYTPYLQDLVDYIKRLAPSATLMWHQTWAYSQSSTHGEFPKYNNDQMTMYNAIVKAARQTVNDYGFSILIPSGTAIQNARTTFLGDNMNRDGYHLDLKVGRYTAACTWFEAIFGTSVVGNKYVPHGVSPAQALASQEAAHAAVYSPDSVTDLSFITLPVTTIEEVVVP